MTDSTSRRRFSPPRTTYNRRRPRVSSSLPSTPTPPSNNQHLFHDLPHHLYSRYTDSHDYLTRSSNFNHSLSPSNYGQHLRSSSSSPSSFVVPSRRDYESLPSTPFYSSRPSSPTTPSSIKRPSSPTTPVASFVNDTYHDVTRIAYVPIRTYHSIVVNDDDDASNSIKLKFPSTKTLVKETQDISFDLDNRNKQSQRFLRDLQNNLQNSLGIHDDHHSRTPNHGIDDDDDEEGKEESTPKASPKTSVDSRRKSSVIQVEKKEAEEKESKKETTTTTTVLVMMTQDEDKQRQEDRDFYARRRRSTKTDNNSLNHPAVVMKRQQWEGNNYQSTVSSYELRNKTPRIKVSHSLLPLSQFTNHDMNNDTNRKKQVSCIKSKNLFQSLLESLSLLSLSCSSWSLLRASDRLWPKSRLMSRNLFLFFLSRPLLLTKRRTRLFLSRKRAKMQSSPRIKSWRLSRKAKESPRRQSKARN